MRLPSPSYGAPKEEEKEEEEEEEEEQEEEKASAEAASASEEEDNVNNGEEKIGYFDVYGPEAHAEIVFNLGEKETKISMEDIQGLVRWVVADGTLPGWVFIKNKPLISKVVLLYLPGLDAATYISHAKHLQNLTHCCGKPRPLMAPRFIIDPNKSLEMFFTINCRKRKSTGEPWPRNSNSRPESGIPEQSCKESSEELNKGNHTCNDATSFAKQSGESLEQDNTKPFPASYYTLTEAEMQEHRYPSDANENGYVQTQPADGQHYRDLLALDCEMCYTKDGLELTRVSLVDKEGKVILDSLVQPSKPIIDYNTKYSGITPEMMDGVATTIKDVQIDLLKIIFADTILVGHSLENDLAALKLVHRRIIDTALLYRHPRGLLFRPALRILASQFLNRKIQQGTGGHNSIEDAQAAMDLVLLKIRKGPCFGNCSSKVKENLLSVLHKHGNQCSIIDRRNNLQRYAIGPCHSIPCTTDDEALAKAKKEVRNRQRNFVWVQFLELHEFLEDQARSLEALTAHQAQVIALSTCNTDVEKRNLKRSSPEKLQMKLAKLDDRVKQLHSALDPKTMLLVVSGHGDIATVRRLRKLTRDKLLEKEVATQRSWAMILGDVQAEAETALAFACIKT